MDGTFNVVCPHCDATNRLPAGRDARVAKCGRCKGMLFEGKPLALGEARFRRHLSGGDLPLIVDFWAGWCGPCRAFAPTFERAAATLEPKARFIKVDVDTEPTLASAYAVRSIPSLFLFKGGKAAEQHAGVADFGLLKRWVEG